MPCIVRNVDKALQMLGGEKGIDQALFQTGQQLQYLQCCLRPSDPYAHHLLAERSMCKKVLMKVKRHKTTGEGKLQQHMLVRA